MAAALEVPELPADSGLPVRPNMATASAPNPGAVDSLAVHMEALEELTVQGPPDSSTSPEAERQEDDTLLEDEVMLEVWEEEMQDLG